MTDEELKVKAQSDQQIALMIDILYRGGPNLLARTQRYLQECSLQAISTNLHEEGLAVIMLAKIGFLVAFDRINDRLNDLIAENEKSKGD